MRKDIFSILYVKYLYLSPIIIAYIIAAKGVEVNRVNEKFIKYYKIGNIHAGRIPHRKASPEIRQYHYVKEGSFNLMVLQKSGDAVY